MNTKDYIKLYKDESLKVFNDIDNDQIESFVELVWKTYQNNNAVFACGNGGNAGFVANLVSDFALHPFVMEDKSKVFSIEKRFKVFDLCASSTLMTGLMNDLGSEHIFSGQLNFYAEKQDLLIGISGSGNSKNIYEAMKLVKEKGGNCVLITRNASGDCAKYADCLIEIKGKSNYPGQTGKNNNNFHYEDCLSKLTHLATGILKKRIQNI